MRRIFKCGALQAASIHNFFLRLRSAGFAKQLRQRHAGLALAGRVERSRPEYIALQHVAIPATHLNNDGVEPANPQQLRQEGTDPWPPAFLFQSQCNGKRTVYHSTAVNQMLYLVMGDNFGPTLAEHCPAGPESGARGAGRMRLPPHPPHTAVSFVQLPQAMAWRLSRSVLLTIRWHLSLG